MEELASVERIGGAYKDMHREWMIGRWMLRCVMVYGFGGADILLPRVCASATAAESLATKNIHLSRVWETIHQIIHLLVPYWRLLSIL